jgi:cytochrome c oxidase subunit 2
VILASPSILDGAGRESHHVASLWWVMLTMATVVYVVVAAFVVLALTRRRADDGADRTAFIWWGGVLMPIVVLGILAFLTVSTTTALGRTAKPDVQVDVVGHRWWWEVRYPGHRTTANEVHIPVDRTVDLRLTSVDVIHSFWVPQLAGKLDLVPGQTNHLRVRARRTGTFLGECAEYCGLQHANMRFVVVAQSPDDYQRWLDGEPTGTSSSRGEAVFLREACAGCHTIEGTEADGTYGPDLTDFGSRRWLAAKTVRNTPSQLATWITRPDSIKPGVLMPPTNLSKADLRDLVAYLESRR